MRVLPKNYEHNRERHTFAFSYHSIAWLRESTLQSKIVFDGLGLACATERPILAGSDSTTRRSRKGCEPVALVNTATAAIWRQRCRKRPSHWTHVEEETCKMDPMSVKETTLSAMSVKNHSVKSSTEDASTCVCQHNHPSYLKTAHRLHSVTC